MAAQQTDNKHLSVPHQNGLQIFHRFISHVDSIDLPDLVARMQGSYGDQQLILLNGKHRHVRQALTFITCKNAHLVDESSRRA